MKKVVIITECRRFRFNYGETLQAVALNRIISRLGFWCITASYENEKENFNLWFKRNMKEYGIRGLKFELFRMKYMRFPVVRSCQKSDFENLLQDADAVVCGSDCIWYEKDYNSVFFLDFPKIQIPKIAYAPSLRDDIIMSPIYEKRVARWIGSLSCLSTREKAGSRIIGNISQRRVETVLDPVFLIPRKEWNWMSARRIVKVPYVVMYIIGRSSCMDDSMKQIKKRYAGRKMIWITMENNDGYPRGEGRLHVGPAEFISLIRYADAVVTDSFHGSAFSIIYQKQFYAMKRIVDSKDVYDHDCRIKNIFEILGIHNYFLPGERINFDKSQIYYEDINKKLSAERKKSMRYLKDALYIREKG
ncbi:MAG: polysaccharide pyruvyl transferase family protein [Lachnospiraceae bacterium]|nr:polysaccharide pyruvyl transferase family protein [Lachnospiraceae bacterium]